MDATFAVGHTGTSEGKIGAVLPPSEMLRGQPASFSFILAFLVKGCIDIYYPAAGLCGSSESIVLSNHSQCSCMLRIGLVCIQRKNLFGHIILSESVNY